MQSAPKHEPLLSVPQLVSVPELLYISKYLSRRLCTTAIPSLHLPPHDPSLPYGAHGTVSAPQQFLQSGLGRVFLRRVHVLPVIPVAGRDREPGDGDVAGPGGALASTVGEDFVLWG